MGKNKYITFSQHSVYTEVTAVMYSLWMRSLTDSNLQTFRIHRLI